jgi:serine protease Do
LRYEDPKRDLAILGVEIKLEPLRLARAYNFKRGEDVTIIGNPGVGRGEMILQNAVTRGVLSTEVEIKGSKYYQLGVSVNPGNSGGPAIGSTGEVVGVVTARATEEAIGFCIPVADLTDALDRRPGRPAGGMDDQASKHDLFVAARRILAACAIYSRVLEMYVSGMDRAIREGRTASDGLREVAPTIASQLAMLDRLLITEVKGELMATIRDDKVPMDIQRDLRELWSTYSDLKSYTEEPRGSYETFRKKAIELKDSFVHISRKLEVTLGIDLDAGSAEMR